MGLMEKFVKQILALAVLMTLLASARHADAISPRQLVEVVDFSSPVVSPNGDDVAFRIEQASIERNTYDTVWYVQKMDGTSAPRRVADGGVPLRNSAGISLASPVTWAPDGRWIYYRALVDGKIDVWRAGTDGSGAEPVTLDAADVREFSLSPDGKMLSYSVGATREEVAAAEQAQYERGFHIDGRVPVGQGLFRSGNVEGRFATQRYDDDWFDRIPLLGDLPGRWKSVDIDTRTQSAAAPVGRPALLAETSSPSDDPRKPWRTLRDVQGDRVAWLVHVDEGGEEMRRPRLQLSARLGSQQVAVCKAVACMGKAITDAQWRPDSEEVIFTVSDPERGLALSIFRWDVSTDMVRPVIRATGLISGGREPYSACGLSTEAMACVVADASLPPRLERIDIETGKRTILFDPNTAIAQDMTQAPAVRLLRWSDAKGRAFTGQFFPARRKSDGPPPLFVSYYSCDGFLRGGVGDEWPFASLAKHGISALCINQAQRRVMDAVERYELARLAVEGAVDLLAEEGEIDRLKVGMGGLSFGSAVTMWTAANSDVLTAVSVSSPVVSPMYYLLGSLKGKNFLSGLRELWQLGAPTASPERWRVLSPAFHLDRIQVPLLLQVPEQEYFFTLDYAIPLIRDRRADLYVFPNEPHQKFQPQHKLAVYERNLDWFRFWLQDIEDADPIKAAQYSTWGAMKGRQQAVPEAANSDE